MNDSIKERDLAQLIALVAHINLVYVICLVTARHLRPFYQNSDFACDSSAVDAIEAVIRGFKPEKMENVYIA